MSTHSLALALQWGRRADARPVTHCDGVYRFEIFCEEKLQDDPRFWRVYTGVDRMHRVGNDLVDKGALGVTWRGIGGEWAPTMTRGLRSHWSRVPKSRRIEFTTGLGQTRTKQPRTRPNRLRLWKYGGGQLATVERIRVSKPIADCSRWPQRS